MIYESQEQLDEALAYWQKVLRLQDWIVTAELVGFQEMTESCWGAQIAMRGTFKRAQIKIRRDGHWDDSVIDHDQEADLVHELMHLHTHDFKNADGEEDKIMGEERLINLVTHGLLFLYRQIKSKK